MTKVLVMLFIGCGNSGPDGLDSGMVDNAGVVEETAVEPSPRPVDVLFILPEGGDWRRLIDRFELSAGSWLPALTDSVPDLRLAALGNYLTISDFDVFRSPACEAGTDGLLREARTPGQANERFVEGAAAIWTGPSGSSVVTVPFSPQDRFLSCGIERPLEAGLMALTASTSEMRFLGGSRAEGRQGTGDQDNMGFRRANAALVLVIATIEDDCSFIRSDFFAEKPPDVESHVFCHRGGDRLYSPESYADAFRALAAEGVHVFVLAGVPEDLLGQPEAAILTDERMVPGVDPVVGDARHSCTSDTLGGILPPVRLVQFAHDAEERGGSFELASTCTDASIERAWPRLVDFVTRAANR